MDDKEIRETIRKNLIRLRKNNGFTQGEIADKIDKSESAVSSWEKGLSLPDPQTLYKLAKIYGISADIIFSLDASNEFCSKEEKAILEAYRNLNNDQKDMIASALGVKRQDSDLRSSEVS